MSREVFIVDRPGLIRTREREDGRRVAGGRKEQLKKAGGVTEESYWA